MIRTENCLSQIFFKVFLETTFVHVSWYPVHYQPKIFFGFSKPALTPRYTILDSMFPPCNTFSEGRLPLCNTSSEAGALPSEVRIEDDSDRKFSKSIFFQSFSGNHFSPRFMVPCSLLAENIFSVSRSPHLPLDTPFWTRCFPLVIHSQKAGFPFATRAQKREPCPQISNANR